MKRKGFTLVESIVVLVILGILAALLIPAFNEGKLVTEWCNVVLAG